jgi:hypothetical protein
MGITRAIAKSLTNYDDELSVGSKIRRRRIEPLLKLIEAAYSRYGCVSILDIGGTRQYWNVLPKDLFSKYNIRITLINICQDSLASEDLAYFSSDTGDGCDLGNYESGAFHIVHSNSVVEHVGDWERMSAFAKEVRRLGVTYYVQTPNFWFPIEPHCMTPFFHWLPKPLRVALVRRYALGHWVRGNSVSDSVTIVESARLLDRSMFMELFPDAAHSTESFLFLPKSLIAVRQ